MAAAALFLDAKAMDGPRRAIDVATVYFRVKNAGNKEELAVLDRTPVRGWYVHLNGCWSIGSAHSSRARPARSAERTASSVSG